MSELKKVSDFGAFYVLDFWIEDDISAFYLSFHELMGITFAYTFRLL
jgi:hypothetical protein